MPRHCFHMARALRGMETARRYFGSSMDSEQALYRLSSQLTDLSDLCEYLGREFDEEGQLADEASPDLARLRRAVSVSHDRVIRKIRDLIARPVIQKYLQDTFYTEREGRYVLPVRADSAGAIDGIVLASSASGATLFVEPHEITDLNNALKVNQVEVLREEQRILVRLSDEVRRELADIEQNVDICVALDLIEARAKLSDQLNATRPEISQHGRIDLKLARHPLMVLRGDEPVPSDIQLDPKQALILSGPNAGGKTVCLKTLGLFALMLRAGLHLPTGEGSQVPFYGQVLTDIGDHQSLSESLSTFTAQLSRLRRYLSWADASTLVLLDEVMTATDPIDGGALAQAALEAMVDRSAHVITTTHYERLKLLASTDERFVNASVGFDIDRLQPTYTLHIGLAGSSLPIAVARRVGIEESVLDRANALVEEKDLDVSRLLEQLQQRAVELDQARKDAAGLAQQLEAQRRQVEQRKSELEEREKGRLERAHARALDQLVMARRELETVRRALKKVEQRDDLARASRRVDHAAAKLREHAPETGVSVEAISVEELKPGSVVYVESWQAVAEVADYPVRGKVPLLLGGLRSEVPIDQLGRVPASSDPPGRRVRASTTPVGNRIRDRTAGGALQASSNGGIGATLEIKGLRVDDALRELDRFVDDSIRAGCDTVCVVHGRGTGALRKVVREFAEQCVVVSEARPGTRTEGGDAVTILMLK